VLGCAEHSNNFRFHNRLEFPDLLSECNMLKGECLLEVDE